MIYVGDLFRHKDTGEVWEVSEAESYINFYVLRSNDKGIHENEQTINDYYEKIGWLRSSGQTLPKASPLGNKYTNAQFSDVDFKFKRAGTQLNMSISKNNTECNCDLHSVIMVTGCICGAFKREQLAKRKK